jgi:hypothetical protein
MRCQAAAARSESTTKNIMFIATVKDQVTNAMQWAASGSKLSYAALGTGMFIGLVLFKMFFKSVSGFFHSIGFSIGAGGNPAVAAEPGLTTNSRIKMLLVLVIPPACAYVAYVFFPKWFPTVFQ